MNGTENGTINECHVCVQFLRKRYLIAHAHNTGSKVSHLATPLIYAWTSMEVEVERKQSRKRKRAAEQQKCKLV